MQKGQVGMSLGTPWCVCVCVCVVCVGGCSWSHALCVMGQAGPGLKPLIVGLFFFLKIILYFWLQWVLLLPKGFL